VSNFDASNGDENLMVAVYRKGPAAFIRRRTARHDFFFKQVVMTKQEMTARGLTDEQIKNLHRMVKTIITEKKEKPERHAKLYQLLVGE